MQARFTGEYFDGLTSSGVLVDILLDRDLGNAWITGERVNLSFPLDVCHFSAPLGNTVRQLLLPEGRVVESRELAAIARWERNCGRRKEGMWIVHQLEQRWRFVIASLGILITFGCFFYVAGIPAMANFVARKIPARVNEAVGEKTLLAMKKAHSLELSQLSEQSQRELQKAFMSVVDKIGNNSQNYRLFFFRSKNKKANAFALPGGIVVATDAFVKLASNDREICAVFAHDLTHIEEHHGMRSVFQSSGIFFLISMVLGDIASISSLGAGLPALIAESHYSKNFERAADQGAGKFCISKGWGTKPMRSILTKLHKNSEDETKGGFSLISSHPELANRLRLLEALEGRAE